MSGVSSSGNRFGVLTDMLVSALTNNTNVLMDADTEAMGFKYFPHTTSPITDVDMNLNVTGDTSGINLKIRIESDSADAPSGTVLGATANAISSEFTQTVSGFSGLKTLTENTGNLTINVPVWIVVARSSGNSLSASNYFAGRGLSSAIASTFIRCRHHNGTNWTTTAVQVNRGAFVVKHLNNSYSGVAPSTAGVVAPASATDLYGTYRHGLRCKFGSMTMLNGIGLYLVKTGSPNALVVTVYEGATFKYSETIPAASIVNSVWTPIFFTSPVFVSANQNIYIVLSQASDGGTDANDYDSRMVTYNATYHNAIAPPDMAFVYGTGNDPTALTVGSGELPMMFPFVDDPATGLGAPIMFNPGLSGGLR